MQNMKSKDLEQLIVIKKKDIPKWLGVTLAALAITAVGCYFSYKLGFNYHRNQHPELVKFFQKYDLNKDGIVSPREYITRYCEENNIKLNMDNYFSYESKQFLNNKIRRTSPQTITP